MKIFGGWPATALFLINPPPLGNENFSRANPRSPRKNGLVPGKNQEKLLAPQAPLVKNGLETGQNAVPQALGCHQFTSEPQGQDAWQGMP